MAKFGQGFIQALTQPSYQSGLFELGKAAGAAPGEAARSRKLSELYAPLMQEGASASDAFEVASRLNKAGMKDQALEVLDYAKNMQTKEKDKLANKGELALFNMARMMQSTPTEDISRNSFKRQNYLSAAEGYGVNAKRALEILDMVSEEKTGTTASVKTVTEEVIENGEAVIYTVSLDPQTGKEVNRVKIGKAASDSEKEDAIGREDWKNPEIEAYRETVQEQREAAIESRKYDTLLTQTVELAGSGGQVPRAVVGGVLGMTRDFLLSDVAGLGDAVTEHRARLNEVRMKNAIELLPRGPASDRDVKLALDASVDPKNLSPEDRISYIRGMKKIADAEKEYMDGKLRWIEQTGDALTFGYERKVSLDGFNKKVEAARMDNAAVVSVLESELQKAEQLARNGNVQAAKEHIEYVKTLDSIGYLTLLEQQQAEQERYDDFVSRNKITFN